MYDEPDFPNDGAAVSALFAAHQKPLMAFVFRRVGDREDTAEIASEAFRKLWVSLQNGAVENPRAYLYAVARSLISDRRDRQAVRSAHADGVSQLTWTQAVDPRSPEETLLHKDDLMFVMAVLDRMPAARARMLIASKLTRKTYAQIADDEGVSEAVVTNNIHKALVEIQTAMASRHANGDGRDGDPG